MFRQTVITWLAFCVFLAATSCGHCQELDDDEIETDRDSFTPATTLAGRQRLIVESAYSFIDNRTTLDTHSYPELLLRYGLSERLELRLGWNYEIGGAKNNISSGGAGNDEEGAEIEAESNFSYGMKFQVTELDGWQPRSAFILQGITPTEGLVTDSDFVATYVLGWDFTNGLLLDASLRYATVSEEFDNSSVWAPSLVLKKSINERWNAHVEYFSLFSTGKEDETTAHFVSPGLHYLITRDLELGTRVGWGLNEDAANFFANAGVGWRF